MKYQQAVKMLLRALKMASRVSRVSSRNEGCVLDDGGDGVATVVEADELVVHGGGRQRWPSSSLRWVHWCGLEGSREKSA